MPMPRGVEADLERGLRLGLGKLLRGLTASVLPVTEQLPRPAFIYIYFMI